MLEHDGSIVTNHDQKAQVLFNFFSDLLGTAREPVWQFDLNHLYPGTTRSLDFLDGPFEPTEIHSAFQHMHYNASPSPDGFGPSFYKLTWPIVSLTVLSIFQSFHSGRAELEQVNRSHIILLPKNGSARGAADFRPITLQNCTVKALSKVLTS